MKHTETQQREHIRVALHCSGLEQSYNPYYTLVLAHLCAESFAHRITLQYAAWDLLRDLGETEVGGESRAGGLSSSAFADTDDADGKERQARRMRNLGMTLAWVIAKGGADLSIFKVSFVDMLLPLPAARSDASHSRSTLPPWANRHEASFSFSSPTFSLPARPRVPSSRFLYPPPTRSSLT